LSEYISLYGPTSKQRDAWRNLLMTMSDEMMEEAEIAHDIG
jgi:hypothetical protein